MPKLKAIDKVKKSLSGEWKSTNHIAKECSLHWYKSEAVLYRLLSEEFAEKDEKPDTVYWRIKK